MSEITIYSFDKCPFAQRTRMVLIEKDLPFELVEIDVYNKPDWLPAVSPYGKVPVLKHEGNTIYESAIINEYLDEVFPQIQLMPVNHFQRAKARIWMDYCSNRYLPACSQLMRDRNDPEEQEKNLEKLGEIFLFMEPAISLQDEFSCFSPRV